MAAAPTWLSEGEDRSVILTSRDGAVWEDHSPSTSNVLLGVTWGNGTFVVTGVGGTILTSADALHWTQDAGTTNDLFAVAYGDGQFVAVGHNAVSPIMPSGYRKRPLMGPSRAFVRHYSAIPDRLQLKVSTGDEAQISRETVISCDDGS